MDEHRRVKACATWHEVLTEEEVGLSEAGYAEAMKSADELLRQGIITVEDWREMREEADAAHSHAMEKDGRE